MIRGIGRLAFGAVLAGSLTVGAREFPVVADEAQRVVIVANRNDPDSVELARFYADRREIPRENIFEMDLPTGEEMDWHQYLQRLHLPLQRWLMDHDWMAAIEMDLTDDIGRPKLSPAGHRISYLVTCRGVPLKIRDTPDVPADAPESLSRSLRTHRAAVDSELALLNQTTPPRDGVVRNPLFGQSDPGLFGGDAVVRVARLDGPTFPAIRRLVESAIAVEQRGLIGRAMVDIGGPHVQGDKWFEDVAKILTGLDWHPQVDREKSTFKATDRADGVAIYMGWYTGNIDGPFAPADFQFAPGAIALHLHSFSAGSLRLQHGGGWTGPLVARGVAATVGNVYEPYLEFTHHPQLLLGALLSGATLGQAAYFALPALSWQGIVVGDPLYRPATVSGPDQRADIDQLPKRWASYLALRHLATAVPAEGEASADHLAQAVRAYANYPSLALAWELAQLRANSGDLPGAIAQLGMAGFLSRLRADEWGLVAAMARQLSDWDDLRGAHRVWAVVLRQDLPDAVRKAWLPAAIEVARAAGRYSDVVIWEQDLQRLSPPPASPP